MRPTKNTPQKLQPLGFSLARLRSTAAVAAALFAAVPASQAQFRWDGNAPSGVAGDGFLWTNLNNWYDLGAATADVLPTFGADVIFANPAATVGTILLNGDQLVNSLAFTANSYTLGAFGTTNVLTNFSGSITVDPGKIATLNASYGGTSGINLTGGGALYLNNPLPVFGGDITVDGTVAGTTLIHRQEGPGVQYNGVNSAQEFGRFDQVTLGYQRSVRNIFLTNGGEYRIINAGNNSEGNFKNIIISSGGGTLNIAAGYLVQNLDDLGQIGITTEAFTKAGKGRLTITGTMAQGSGTAPALTGGNPLGGIVNINGGMLDLSNQANTTVGANTYVRFGGIAATGTTLNVNNGGTIMINNGTQATLDTPIINLNDGSIFAINGQDHIIGYATATVATPTIVTVTGTSTFLTRDLFGAQTARLPRFRAQLDGTGTLQLLGNTNAGGTPRLVIERNTPTSTFSGTYRLLENTSLEANPRFNASVAGGTGTTIDTGKLLADGDIEFAGWGGTLDLRDSNASAASVLDYTTNEITITATQAGSVNTIAPVRATAATGTGHMFNFGTLTIGNHILQIGGNNSYQTAFADPARVTGNAVIRMNSDLSPLVFTNAAAITENAAGRSLTLIKTGNGNAGARDVISGGAISISSLEVASGTLQMRGANGIIAAGFGGAAPTITVNGGANNFANGLSTQGVLHLDSNGAHVVGATTVIAAANNNDRIIDTATLNMRSNSTLRMTSQNNGQTTEIIGTTNVSGHGTFDLVKTGTATAPIALTLTAFNMVGISPTANFTGTSLGLAGNNTTRVVIPGTPNGFMGPQFHAGNEWAKYDGTADSGFALGVTPFLAADYTLNTAESTWAAGQSLKYTLGGTFLTANRTVDRINLALPANQSINLNGSVLTLAQGGIITSTNTTGFIDTNATFPTPSGSLTAGTTASPAQLFVHANALTDIKVPIVDNVAGGSVDFVKSGTNTVRLTHQSLGLGVGATAIAPFTGPTWTSTLTGSWIINDGRLEVHRGQYLGGRPVILNGGHLEINEPVANANADSIIPNWGNNITVNGNAAVVSDDNGESDDANGGDRNLVKLGSLTVNNGAILSLGQFSDSDFAFMGGATFSGTPTLALVRGGTNTSNIINGVLAGSGFTVTNYNGTGTVELGGTQTDATNNTYSGAITIYASTVRVNKANGFNAITNGTSAEDVVINGGTLAWGTGHHGDLTSTNNINLTNNGIAVGIAPTSPAAIKNAGGDQIEDGVNITLLSGALGEADRINNETFNALIQKNGTFNVGLGTIRVASATISGGAFNIDRGGTFAAGAITLLPGAPDLNVTTGLPVGAQTTLEIGAGGVSLSGQSITLGTGSSASVAGSGGVLRLGGNVTVVGSDLVGGSYGRKGIYIQTGNSFREIGNSRIDLAGGTRDFNIDTDALFTITAPLTNGGISKSGGGGLSLESYIPNTFAGPVIVNGGTLSARSNGAFGTSAGGVTINTGGTVKLESSWIYGDTFTVTGPGALIPGGITAREVGALVAESGFNRLTGGVVLAGNATLAGNTFLDPSVTPAAGGAFYRPGTLSIEGAGGVTGTGTLTLSGHGIGIIQNGVNTVAGGLVKDGAGRWTISGASGYTGLTSISAGTLRIANGGALGSALSGTTIFGGSLELIGGISVAEPMNISGDGTSAHSGAIVSLGGTNTLTGAITLFGATLRSEVGVLNVNAPITGGATYLKLEGSGNGSINGVITLGAPATGDVLTKNGSGTWTLSVANALNGSTAINGGTLALTGAGAKLHALSPLNMGGGNITVTGAAQTVSGLNLNAGGAAISGGPGLAVGLITRTAGATATFAGTVTAVGTTNDAGGILGGYATVGSDWARVVGGGAVVGALPGSSYVDLATATATDNAIRSVTSVAATPVAVHSLKITGGTGLDLGANTLTLNSGGIIFSGAMPSGISGSGLITGATGADEVFVHVTGATLDITAPIIGGDAGGLTKSGAGKLVLSASNSFFGPININGGTLSVVSSAALGAPAHTMNINGGAFEIVGNDFDPAAGTLQVVIGGAGGTIRASLGAQISLNDPGQFSGPGDITYTGGGRYRMLAGTPRFTAFTGNVTIDTGVFSVGDPETIGGRQDQTITLRPGSAILNGAGFGLGQNGLPNNVIVQGGNEIYASGGNRAFSGDVQLNGTNTIALMDRDSLQSERQIFLNGNVTGAGVTLDVFGVVNSTPLYLASGGNNLTGTINLNTNAALEVRTPGSAGLNDSDVTVNLNGANSRLLLRHFQDGDFHVNVTASDNVEINSDRLANYAAGANQSLTINNLTFSGGDKILTFAGANAYKTWIAGTATFNGDAIINTSGADVLFENGINFASGTTLDKRGAGVTMMLRGPSNHTGTTLVQAGILFLDGGGTLPNTSTIDLRGGELRVDNSSFAIANRIKDTAGIILAGGTLRITGPETIGAVTAPVGNSSVFFNQINETVAATLAIPSLSRTLGAVVNFGSDIGGAVGSATLGNTRVSSRIIIGGQADVTGNSVIAGYFGNSNLDFVQYDNTTIDPFTGLTFGVRELRNPTPINGPTYQADTAETAWDDADIVRVTTAKTLTASRALEAVKIEAAVTIALAGFNLRVETGGILTVGNAVTLSGAGLLTAGAAVATAGTAELFLGGNNTLTLSSIVGDNAVSGQNVALVKMGTGTVSLTAANTYSGGTYVNSGTLNTTNATAFGAVANPIFLNGGTLQFNVANAGTGVDLGVPDHAINVNANSLIVLDNGATATLDNDISLGSLTITGPYTVGIRGFDSVDVSFTGTHSFTGTPTIDLPQAGSGSNPNTVAAATVVTIGGSITGSGFYVTSSANTNDTAARLQIGAGEAIPNTYVGKVTILQGSNTEDTFVELNKAAGTTAITGDLELNGGNLIWNFDDQVADTSNLVNNRTTVNFNGKNETLASVTMRGGHILTNPATAGSTPPANVINITGAVTLTGLDDQAGGFPNTGFSVGNNSTVNIGGLLTIGTYGRMHLAEGATGSVLNVNGGLEMTGALLSQSSGAGPNITRLSSDVTTLAAIIPSNIGNSTDSDTFTELNGTRTFNIADGPAGMDFQLSSVVRDSTAPVAVGGLVKNGAGTMQLQGGGTANSYTGLTRVNNGALVLFKSTDVNSITSGTAGLFIGDSVGASRSAQVIVRNSGQISDVTDVTLAVDGLLDLDTFNTTDIIGNLTGVAGSVITLGPTSRLSATSTVNTTFSGDIVGGVFAKEGAADLTLNGTLNATTIIVNAGTLNVNSNANFATVNAASTLNFGVSQDLTALNIGAGPFFAEGDAVDAFAAPAETGVGASAVVPEPGALSMLVVGALGLLGRRRRK